MDSPQLMIAPADPGVVFSNSEAAAMGKHLRELIESGQDVVFSFAVNIWQLVDGRWEALPTNTESEVPDGAQVIRP